MYKKTLLLTSILLLCNLAFSQDYSDARRLAKLGVLKYANTIHCDNTSETSIEQKVCLHIEFQKLDSILNSKYISFLKTIKSDSTRTKFAKYHRSWITNRRQQCKWIAKGLQGHSLGIQYMDCLVKTTWKRIEEIDYLLTIDSQF